MEYTCNDCGMSVKNLACGQCNSELRPNSIKDTQGNSVKVSECPQGHGKIKSPMCCGHDMAQGMHNG